MEFYQNHKMPITKLNKYFTGSGQLKSNWPSKRIPNDKCLKNIFFLNAYICCKSCKEALYTLPLITMRELKRIKTAQKCIFLRTKTNLLQLFSSIYNSQFLWGNILHKPNKYKVLCPNTFKLVAIPKVGRNITSKKNFFKIWSFFSWLSWR